MTNVAADVLFYNNTIFTVTSAESSANVHGSNSLILGENSSPAIFSVNTNYSSSDSGFSSESWKMLRPSASNGPSPPWPTLSDYAGILRSGHGITGNSSLETRQFAALAKYRSDTHQDELDTKDLKPVHRLYRADNCDFRLKPGSGSGGSRRSPAERDRWLRFRAGPGTLEIGQMPHTTGLARQVGRFVLKRDNSPSRTELTTHHSR